MNEKSCSKCKAVRPIEEFAVYGGKPFCWCRNCQRKKSLEYRKNNKEKVAIKDREWRARNPGYSAAHSRKWRAENRDKYRASLRQQRLKALAKDPLWERKRNLKQTYGITLDQYNEMLRQQHGGCAICGGLNVAGRNLAVDHNHRTEQVRGLLCSNCNTMIGYCRENTLILVKAINYLNEHESKVSPI